MVLESRQKAIENLEASYNGSSVKEALISLLETFNSMGGDVQNLGGQTQKYYVLESEVKDLEDQIDRWLKYNTEPMIDPKTKVGSLNLIKNKDLTAYFGNILNRLRAINGKLSGKQTGDDEDLGGNIKESLVILQNTIGLIEEAINNKATGEDSRVQPTDSVMDLATRISNIKMANLEVKPILITEKEKIIESDIVRDEQGNIISGHAYNPVNVKVALKGYDGVLTTTGTHTPPEGYDGYSKVEIKVSESGTGGGGNGGSGAIENAGSANLTTAVITENGEVPKPAGYDGYSEITIDVKNFEIPEGKTFTVTYQMTDENKETTILFEDSNVLPGQRVTYPGDTSDIKYDPDDKDFWYFSGWAPEPKCVVADMTVNAQFAKYVPVDIGGYYRYTNKSWGEILSDGGYTVGSGEIKLLRLTDNRVVKMLKLGSGDAGATSAWLCMNASQPPSGSSVGSYDWNDSPLREYLNGHFLQYLIPDWLRPHIKQVRKYHACRSGVHTLNNFHNVNSSGIRALRNDIALQESDVKAQGLIYKETADYIWIPGADELGLTDGDYNSIFASNQYTSNSVQYDSVWRQEEYQEGGETKIRYKRTGYKNAIMYDKAGRKITKVPAAYNRGLFHKNGYAYSGPRYMSTGLKIIPNSQIQSFYTGGAYETNVSADYIISENFPNEAYSDGGITYNNINRYNFFLEGGSEMYLEGLDRFKWDPPYMGTEDPISQNVPLRDVSVVGCNFNDGRINDTYDPNYNYNRIPETLASYRHDDEYCTATYARGIMRPLGYYSCESDTTYFWFGFCL